VRFSAMLRTLRLEAGNNPSVLLESRIVLLQVRKERLLHLGQCGGVFAFLILDGYGKLATLSQGQVPDEPHVLVDLCGGACQQLLILQMLQVNSPRRLVRRCGPRGRVLCRRCLRMPSDHGILSNSPKKESAIDTRDLLRDARRSAL
jgi:hypothetical protein